MAEFIVTDVWSVDDRSHPDAGDFDRLFHPVEHWHTQPPLDFKNAGRLSSSSPTFGRWMIEATLLYTIRTSGIVITSNPTGYTLTNT